MIKIYRKAYRAITLNYFYNLTAFQRKPDFFKMTANL